jgi:hypothetical protein
MFVDEQATAEEGEAASAAPGPAGEPLGEVPLDRLQSEIEALAAHINAGSCRWLELVAEFDRRGGWHDTGCRSCAEWVSWRCAIAPRAAREHLRVAHRLGELPRIAEAFRAGRLSYSKVRALTRVAQADCEEDLLHFARYATAAQLERIVRGYRRVTRREANRSYERAYLNWHWDEDGSLRINGRLPAEDGALLLRALEGARDALAERAWERDRAESESGSAEPPRREEGGSAEPSEFSGRDGFSARPAPPRPTHAQALAALAESALASGPLESSGGERYQVVIHAEAAALWRDHPDGRCRVDDGPSVAADTARRLACDASLVTILERDGMPLSVGRRRRTIPPSLRRALQSRDRTCRFPGCERRRFTDAHHIEHWAHGGDTSLENLVLLCRHHHRLLHEGGYSIERKPSGEIAFRHPRGWPIPLSPRPPGSGPGRLVAQNRSVGLEIDRETCLRGSGERMHLGWNVEAMYDAIHPRGREPAGRGSKR